MQIVPTRVSAEIGVESSWFFYWFLTVNPSRIMHRYGLIPGIVGVEDQTGPMHVPGSSRVLLLSDGTTAVEQVTSCDPPKEVTYRLYKLTNVFRYFVAEARGELWFREAGDGGTRVEWRYSFIGRNLAAALVLRILIPLQYKGFMKATLVRAERLALVESRTPTQ